MKNIFCFLTLICFLSPALSGVTTPNPNYPSGIFINFLPAESDGNTTTAEIYSGSESVATGTKEVTESTSAREIKKGIASMTTDFLISPMQALIIVNEIDKLSPDRIPPFIQALKKKLSRGLAEGRLNTNINAIIKKRGILKKSPHEEKGIGSLTLKDSDEEGKNNSCSNRNENEIKRTYRAYHAHPTPVDDLLSSLPIWTQMSIETWREYQPKQRH